MFPGKINVFYDTFDANECRIHYGISPPRPSNFSPDQSATEKENIKLSATYTETCGKTLFEVSLDGGKTWRRIGTTPTGTPYNYIVPSLEDIPTQIQTEGYKTIKIRAKGYANEDPIIGKSLGYIEKTLFVYPQAPSFEVEDDTLCSDKILRQINLKNITLSSYVDEIIVDVTIKNELVKQCTIPKSSIEDNKLTIKLNGEHKIDTNSEDFIKLSNIYKGYLVGESTKPFSVTVLEPISIELNYPTKICTGSKSEITATISRGNDSQESITYTSTLNDSITNVVVGGGIDLNTTQPKFQNVPEGSYIFTVEDNYGCTATSNLKITKHPSLTLNIQSGLNQQVCNGAKAEITGSITGTGTDNSPSVKSINLYKGANLENTTTKSPFTFEKVEPGAYTVKLIDSNGCITEKNINITQRSAAISFNTIAVRPTCFGGSNGSIEIKDIENTIGNISVTCNPTKPVTKQGDKYIISNLPARKYAITVQDEQCSSSSIVTVTQPAQIGVTPTPTHVTGCNSANNGAISVNVTNAVGNYTTDIKDASNNSVGNTGLSQGNYTVTVTDDNGCQESIPVTINNPDNSFSTTITGNNPTCYNSSDGEIVIVPSIASAQYYYSIDDEEPATSAEGDVTITNLENKNYKIKTWLQKVERCSTSTNINLITPQREITVNTTNPNCNGGKGTATIEPISGAKYFYKKGSGTWVESAENVINLHAGTYSFKTKVGECESSVESDIIIAQPDTLSIIPTASTITCHGGTSAVQISITGGTAPYTTTVDNLNSSEISQGQQWTGNLGAGNHKVKITYNKNCQFSTSFTISEPNQFQYSIGNQQNPTCSGGEDGAFDLRLEGGTPPYQISLTNNKTGAVVHTISGTSQLNHHFTNLAAGDYSFSIKDNCNVELTPELSLLSPEGIQLASQQTAFIKCNGNYDAAITVSLGGNYNTSDAIQLFKNEGTAPIATQLASKSTIIFNDLGSGTYTILHENANGCQTTNSVTITEPAILSVNASTVNASCFGSESGKVDVAIAGGTPPYNIRLLNSSNVTIKTTTTSSSSLLFSGIGAGVYSLEINDANSCSASKTGISISNPAQPIAMQLVPSPITCFGKNDGSITAEASGGWGNYLYSLNSSNEWKENGSFSNLPKGSHTIHVKDAMGCEHTAQTTILEPAPISISTQTSITTCFGDSDGSITLSASGGNGQYQYSFDGGITFESSNIKTGLPAANYNVAIIDQKGCNATAVVTVSQPDNISINVITDNHNGYPIRCWGEKTDIDIEVAGGTQPYALNVDTHQLTNLLSNTYYNVTELGKGSYTITVTDNLGCSQTKPIELDSPNPIELVNMELIQPLCNGGSNGEIIIHELRGGVTNYSLRALSNQEEKIETSSNGKAEIAGFSAGEVTLTITDANLCSLDSTFAIGEPSPVTISLTIDPVRCKGESNGNIVAVANGGTPSYVYKWTSSSNQLLSTQDRLVDQVAGNYLLEVMDSHGCFGKTAHEDSNPITVSIPEPSIALTIVGSNNTLPRCYNEENGKIEPIAEGGWGEYEFANHLKQFSQNDEFEMLKSGTHKFYVRDALGCIDSLDILLSQPEPLTVAIEELNNANCYGLSNGSITIKGEGGNGYYRYSELNLAQNRNGIFQNLSAGNYSFIVTDTLNCEAVLPIEISQPEQIQYSKEIANPYCKRNDGSITIQPMGGVGSIEINWENSSLPNSLSVENLFAGSYSFTLTDSYGCARNFTETLNDVDGPSLTILDTESPTCSYRNDGSISLQITGVAQPYTVSLGSTELETFGSATLNELYSGTHTIHVEDTNGCFTSQVVTLNAPSPLNLNVIATPVTCKGSNNGSISATLNGGSGTKYLNWFTANGNHIGTDNQVSLLLAGNYFVSIKDENLCGVTSDSDTLFGPFTVAEPLQELTLNVQNKNKPICHGNSNGSITLAASGGWGGYLFSSNGTTFSQSPTCSNLSAGEHILYVTDSKGCAKIITTNLDEPAPVNAFVSSQSDAKCFNQSDGRIVTMAEGGTPPYSYSMNKLQWNTHGQFMQLPEGSYKIYSRDKNSCLDSTTATLSQPNLLEAAVASVLPSYCNHNNGQATISVMGGTAPYQSRWNHTSSLQGLTVSSLENSTYNVSIIDANGCTTPIVVTIPKGVEPTLSVTGTQNPLCFESADGSVSINVESGTMPYQLLVNNQTVSNTYLEALPKGEYSIKIIDAQNCKDSTTVSLTAPPALNVSIANALNPKCFETATGSAEAIATGGTQPYSIEWSNGNNVAQATNLLAGTYSVLVADNHGCAQSQSVTLTNPEPITTSLPQAVPLCIGQTATLDAENIGSSYWWTSNVGIESFERTITVSNAGSYYLMITSPIGCFGYDTVTVRYFDYNANATLLVPSTAQLGDTLVILDISWPVPDALSWEIPSSFQIVNDYPYEKWVIPTQLGVYSVGMVAFTGECSAYQVKSVTITEAKPNTNNTLAKKEKPIKSVEVAPNPASNLSTTQVTMNYPAAVTVELVNNMGLRVFFKDVSTKQNQHNIALPIQHLMPGIYIVRVTSGTDSAMAKLIIQ
ncbi:MAG: T9SS type A sorting domain-containing protein [Bacteroidales bacterium]|nr:T9SS type A sorting domain-containing protein [Bacteroidales bacterium]